jgi:hypothetical protein
MRHVAEVIEDARIEREPSASPAPLAALAPAPPQAASPLDLPAEVFRAGLDRRKANRAALMDWIRAALIESVDYGVIQTRRGPSKPSLWKPGAEKICGMLGVTVHFPTLHDYEQAALHGVDVKHIIIRCEIHDAAGRVVADGIGARTLSQDSGDLNKALKMAEKSAHIDATLRMAGLSEVFTQDLEDMRGSEPDTTTTPPAQPEPAVPERISDAQKRRLEARIGELQLDRERVKAWMVKAWGVERFADLTADQYERLGRRLEFWAQAREEAARTAEEGRQ